MGQQRAIRELSQSLAALPEALCIEKKRSVLMNGSFEGKKKKKQNSTFRTKTKSTNIQKDIP